MEVENNNLNQPRSLKDELIEKETSGTITEKETYQLKAIRKFPNNPRGQELLIKFQEEEVALTQQEQAELNGLIGFPNNPRGSELIQKRDTGEITSEEQEELDLMLKRKNDQEKVGNSRNLTRSWIRTSLRARTLRPRPKVR